MERLKLEESKLHLIKKQANNDLYLSNGDLSADMSSMSNMNSNSDAASKNGQISNESASNNFSDVA